MRVALSNERWAEFRDHLMRGDVRGVRKGMIFITGPDGTRRADAGMLDELTGNLITAMLIDWHPDLGPKPREAQSQELAQQILDRLDEDDYAVLEKAVGPWVEKVLRRGMTPQFTHLPTGVVVEPADEGDAARLDASADFSRITAPGDAGGPKSALTAISSSASPDQPGQEGTTDPTP